MRDFKNMKRQRGRNRSGGSSGGGGGGGRPQQNANRAFESNGPDNVKIRGHAQHVFEKYQQLARDAFSSGDRVLAENYLQHADHYFRLLRTIQPNRPASEILGRDTVASGLDIDFEEEFEAQPDDAGGTEAPEGGDGQQGFEPRQDGARQEGGRQEGGRYDRDTRQDRYDGNRNDTAWRDRSDNRQDRDRQDRDRQETRSDTRTDNRQDNRAGFDRSYGDRQDRNRNSYAERPQEGERNDRFEGQRNDRFDGRRDNRRFDNPRRDEGRGAVRENREPRVEGRTDGFAEGPQPTIPEASEPLTRPATPVAAAPTERTEASPVLRSHDGEVSEAPAFLQAAEGEEARPRVRRRRAPRSFQPGEDGAEPTAPATEET